MVKILFMVQLPPPVHGASLRNQSLVDSQVLQKSFAIRVLPLSFVEKLDEIGKFSWSKLGKAWLYAARLVGMMRRFRPAIAYFTLTPSGGAFYRDVLFVFLLKLTSVKIVYHLRGFGIRKGASRNAWSRALYRYVFRETYVVCLSKSHLEDIAGLPYRKHFVVHNGIKVEIAPDQAAVRSSSFQFLFLSNFVLTKGLYDVLEAARLLREKRDDFSILVVGGAADVNHEEVKKKVEALGLSGFVEVSVPRYGKEKFNSLLTSQALVFPTYYSFEVFPGVILEAMQCGLPVISTRHGVIADIVDDGETGLLIEPRRIDALVEKMKFLLENRASAISMGEAGRRKFFREYTLERFETNMKAVFNDVANLRNND
jgi:glycosyltransferase involved in cell wall biosynthesis